MPAVGNDIVDLGIAGSRGKSSDARFLKRVFTPAEQAAIGAAADPERMLWIFWAAKESAYKIVSRIRPPAPFAHRQYACQHMVAQSGAPMQVQVHYTPAQLQADTHDGPWQLKFRVNADAHCVHAYGATASAGNWLLVGRQDLTSDGRRDPHAPPDLDGFSSAECTSIRSVQSAAVRIACKQALARRLKLDIGRLQIIRPVRDHKPQPPYLLIDGDPCDIGISLSHHGRWLAWCCARPAP